MKIDLYNNKTLFKKLYKESIRQKKHIFYDSEYYDGFIMGNEVWYLGKDINNNRWLPRNRKGQFVKIKCSKCGRKETKEGHDPCIANLPGVLNACCGHGTKEGYIMFENGITIRGNFEVEQ